MPRGKATFRKRDLRIAMEVAGNNAIVEVTKTGSIIITPPNNPGGKASVNVFDVEAEKLRRKRGIA